MTVKKRKISVRKILQVLLTVVVTSCCIVAMVSASKIEGSKYLATVEVHIKNDKKYHFIEQAQIMDLAVNNRHVDIMHTPLADLDIHAIEQVIKSDPWVAGAQAYIDIDRVLHMNVTQRVPVVRIFERSDTSYYMDASLSTMPLSDNYIYYTMVVTNVPPMANDSAGDAMKMKIYAMAMALQADTFWNAQISQVAVDSVGMFELVPVLGNHKILFGDTTNTKDKLANLMVFYKKVLNRIGWDKYQTLDLRFRDQVIASPSLPYKGPVDKATANPNGNMNWINSIIITEAQNDTRDSLKVAEISAIMAGSASAHGQLSADSKLLAPVSKTTAVPATGGTGTAARAAVAVGVVGAAGLAAKHLSKPVAVPPAKQAVAKASVPAKPAAKALIPGKQKGALKPPSAPFGKNTIKAQPVAKPKAKATAKEKAAAAKAKDKKKAKAPAKKIKGKAVVPKKAAKPVQGKKPAAKAKDTKRGKPKYAYPDNKGH